jgi:hypothetical protein
MTRSRFIAVLWLAASAAGSASAQEFEQEPIRYSQSRPDNRVSKLIDQIAASDKKLVHEDQFGYLRSLLVELDVPVSSQMLVFSKTSLQRQRISPRTPRALYFNDDVYVGYCQQGEVLEISAVDPNLGAVFYTLDQESAGPPSFRRQTDNCLICHGSSQTKEVPGHVVRSVYAGPTGLPILSAGTVRVDQTTPLAKRWGGWYVTGTHGEQTHLGNLVVRESKVPEEIDNSAGLNQTSLSDHFDTPRYLTGHSDIVALMVLEHQADAHNLITRANFLTRQAVHYQQALNRELNEPADRVWDSTKSRIRSACEPLVEYVLFCDEAELTDRVEGTSGFAAEFAQHAIRDRQGRSLRDFDLTKRLFKYPCSYLIYSPSLEALPREAKDYVWGRLWSILSGEDQSPKFAHLTSSDRQAILDILRHTLPSLPDCLRVRTTQ